MADEDDKDECEIREECKGQKDLIEKCSNEDSQSLVEKSRLLSTLGSPCNKRPFVKCSQENEIIKKRTKQNSVDSETPQCLEHDVKQTPENKRELVMILRKKEEVLRKLNLVKMYRAKNNLSDLEDLITKWRSLSQTATQDLYDKFSKDKVVGMGQFLDGMRISHDLIKYSEEDETFY